MSEHDNLCYRCRYYMLVRTETGYDKDVCIARDGEEIEPDETNSCSSFENKYKSR